MIKIESQTSYKKHFKAIVNFYIINIKSSALNLIFLATSTYITYEITKNQNNYTLF